MPDSAQPKWMTWTGWVLTVLVAAMLIMSGVVKFTDNPDLKAGIEKMRITRETVQRIGVAEIACAVLYLVPQTTVLGAIVVTGYLGGAIFAHVQQGEPLIVPIAIAVVAWFGVFFREPRLREIAPLRTAARSRLDG
jgi:uncharacterized membrane protein YphA (DoxX/SURF4 family)